MKVILALLLVFLLGTSTMPYRALATDLPDMGDPSDLTLSPYQAQRIGAGLLRQIRAAGVLVEDPELEAYIQSLGNRLSAYSGDNSQTFTFFLVNDPAINAFAAPGGFIGVHTGLILASEDESELAGVMAHEIAHVTQNHMARTYEAVGRLNIPSAIAMLGAILLATQNPQAGTAALTALNAGSAQYQINFIRANEKEADRIGIGTLAEAGFDPQGMPSFFERLQMANRYTDPAFLPEFLRTHPVTVSRIADSRNRARQFESHEYRDDLSYYLAKAKLRVGVMKPEQAVAYYETRLREGSYRNEEAARYGYALALGKAKENGKAKVQLDHLLNGDNVQSAYLLAAARLEIEEKNFDRGLAIYVYALDLYPGSRAVILEYASALLTAQQPEKAKNLLRKYTLDHEPDILYYALMAEAQGKMGEDVESYIAMAEFYYLSGQTDRALDQLKAVQTTATLSNYQSQRISSRILDLEEELKEEKEAS